MGGTIPNRDVRNELRRKEKGKISGRDGMIGPHPGTGPFSKGGQARSVKFKEDNETREG